MVFPLKRVIRAAILAGLPFGLLRAQSSVTSPYIPSIIPPSPNAAALMKFTDVPVSPYTGTADISVPIYTIKAKGITVPVAISYHTGGIRLEEEASWVGLGWALNAGGMISRTIMGHDDFGTQGDVYLTNSCPQLAGDISSGQSQQQLHTTTGGAFDFWCNYLVNTSSGMEDFWPAFGSGADVYDMEPDIFSYSFPGHSGKFILTRAGKVVMQKQENIRIQFQGSGGAVTFTITDDQGNTFFFTTLEAMSVSPYTSTSSWLLSKIVTQQGDNIVFNYVGGGTTASSLGDVHQTYANYCTAVDGNTFTNAIVPAYYNQTLQSIDFPNGHLQFDFDGSRSDLSGAYKLDSVLIYSKDASGSLTYQKQDNFYYSYFNPTLGGSSGTPLEYYRLKLDSVKEVSGTTALPPYAFTYNNSDPGIGTQKHAYNIDHWGYYNGASNTQLIPTMSISYNPIVNEQASTEMLSYSGANRAPAWPAAEVFSLQQVTYPTGGKTVLAYEANDYDYSNSIRGGAPDFQYVQTVPIVNNIVITNHGTTSGTIDLTNVYPVISEGQPGTNVTISIAFRYQKNDTFPYSNYSGKLYFMIDGIDQDIHTATCQSGQPVCTALLNLPMAPGIYNWTAYIDPAVIDTVTTFAGIYVSVQYNETQQAYNLLQNGSEISPASGLRIHSISNYKDANTIASQKVYSYNYTYDRQGTGQPQQYSYGRLMSIPSYARYWLTPTSTNGVCTALALYSSTMTSLTSVIQGNIVGYDQVVEKNVDPITGQDIGQTVYQYHNSSDTPVRYGGYGIPGVLNMGDNLNGLLTAKIDYANKDGVYYKVDETDYNYYTTNRIVYYSPKYQYWQPQGIGGSGCTPDTGVAHETSAWFYPSIKSERVLLGSKVNMVYQQGDTTQSVTSTETDYYDNPAHYQVTRAQTLDSKGNTLTTQFRYPQDYIPSGGSVTGNTILDTLIGRNMVDQNIEKVDNLVYSGSSTNYVTGAQLNLYRLSGGSNTVVPDRTYKLDVQSPVTDFTPFSISGNSVSMDSRNRQMVSFDQYDGNNNLQQYTSTDQNPVTIIWDYNHIYPIAQVKNATAGDVATTSFEADGTGGIYLDNNGTGIIATDAITGSHCYQINNALAMFNLDPTKTYIVSLWAKSGTPSYNGFNGSTMTVATNNVWTTGKTVNGWTYLEKSFTNVATINVGGGGGLVDEVRFYPSTAQMTTYTYSPLVGTTSQCDVDNRVSYYFYDRLGRLKYIKDQDGNIIKTFDYHYQGQTHN